MSWQLFISVSVILYSISVLIQRLILKEDQSNPVSFSIFFQFLTGVVIGIAGFIFSDMSLPSNLSPLLLNMALMIVLYGFANIFIFKSLKVTEASVFTILFATRGFFTVLASSLLLKEFLTGLQLVGALLIFISIILVNYKSKRFSFGKGELLALLGGVIFGLANTNDRYLLNHFNVYPYVSIGFIAPSLLMATIYPKELRGIKELIKKGTLGKMFLLSTLYAASAVTFFYSLQITSSSSQVASINLTNIVLTVLLSIIFLKERSNIPKKAVGAILTFIGLLLLL